MRRYAPHMTPLTLMILHTVILNNTDDCIVDRLGKSHAYIKVESDGNLCTHIAQSEGRQTQRSIPRNSDYEYHT